MPSITLWCHTWVKYVFGSCHAPRVFPQQKLPGFSSLHKKQHLQIPIWPGQKPAWKPAKLLWLPRLSKYYFYLQQTHFFALQTLPVAIASVRNVHSQCPREVLQFILDLIKYNDNRLNKVSEHFSKLSLNIYREDTQTTLRFLFHLRALHINRRI